jgi:glycosyltransferase involved in cell wall biosynthesis
VTSADLAAKAQEASGTDAAKAHQSLTVWILQTGEPLPSDTGNPRPMRAMNLAAALVAAGHKVVLWSSSFYHQEKRHRVPGDARIDVMPGLQVRLVASPGYGRNIGPGRLWDHAVLARNLARALASEDVAPDVGFVGYPPIETAAVMTRWLKLRGVPSMLDVKDQWPTIFTDPLPGPLRPLGRLALAPYFHYGRRAMRDASALSAMASDFLQWAASFAGREVQEMDMVVPLTVPMGQVSADALAEADHWWDAQGVVADGRTRICFVGSHSPAFDIEPVYLAAKALADKDPAYEFVLCGDGANTPAWKARMQGLANVRFPGWVDRAKVESLARRSSAALAPYRNSADFMLSVPNKVIDALALGLPILSPLQGEVTRLITGYDTGLVYGEGTGRTLADRVQELSDQPQRCAEMASNARRLYGERFSFETVYGALVRRMEELAQGARRS